MATVSRKTLITLTLQTSWVKITKKSRQYRTPGARQSALCSYGKNIKFVLLKAIGKIIPIFLLGVILFIGARYLVFTTIIKFHKHEFRRSILKQDHPDTRQLLVPANELFQDLHGIEWKENNKEIVTNDQYHEVLSIVKHGETYIVNIIEDHLENNLFHHFFNKSKTSEKLADYLLLVFALNFAIPPQQELQQPIAQTFMYKQTYMRTHCSGVCFKTIKPPQPFSSLN